MDSKGDSHNIFDEAAESAKKKKGTYQEPQKGKVSDREAEQMIARMHEMRVELENKAEQVVELSGMPREDIEKELENLPNTDPKTLELITRKKEKLEEKIREILEGQVAGSAAPKGGKKTKKSKGQRKFLGRRKGWISMD